MRTSKVVLVVALLVALGVALAAVAPVAGAAGPSSAQFTDIASSAYKTAIESLAAAHVINGVTPTTFRPDDSVTRQQFAKMIVLSLSLPVPPNGKCPFADVDSGLDPTDPLYPDHYVAVCAANGITEGKTPGHFAPYDNISRAQLASMVVRAAQRLAPAILSSSTAVGVPTYDAPPHTGNITIAMQSGLFNGLSGIGGPSWDPTRPSTRGEIAQVLFNLRQRIRPGSLLFADDLGSPSGNWKTVSSGPGHFDFDSAAYVGEVPAGNLGVEARTKLNGVFADFHAEVVATHVAGDNAGFGMCALVDQASGDPAVHGGYKFEVLSSGEVLWWEYGATGQLRDHGQTVLPASAGPEAGGLEAAGMAPLNLAVDCKPDYTSFSVNGQQVVKVTPSSDTPKSGAVSLFVDSQGNSQAKVAFSEFKIDNAGSAKTYSLTVNAVDPSGTLVGPVHAGDVIDVRASGQWDMGSGNIGGPDGIVMPHADEMDLILNTSPIGMLIGRIGTQLVPIGGENSFASPADGDFYLVFNDRPAFYGDNAGSMTAQVEVYSTK